MTAVLCFVIFVLFALASAEMTITYDIPAQYAARTSRITFKLDETSGFDTNVVYQFGHASQCQYLDTATTGPLFDNINTCYVTSEPNTVVATITPSCDKFTEEGNELIAFSIQPSIAVPAGASVTCWVQYVNDPLIGRVADEPFLFRALPKDTPEPLPAPTTLTSTYTQFTQYTTTMVLDKFNYQTNEATITITTPAAGVFKFNYNKEQLAIASEDVYCTAKRTDGAITTAGRVYKDENGILFLHKHFGPLAAQPLTCTLTITPAAKSGLIKADAVLILERATPYESLFYFDAVVGGKIAVPSIDVPEVVDVEPTEGTLTIPFYFPAGIEVGAKVWLNFDTITLPEETSATVCQYITGYTPSTTIPIPEGFKITDVGQGDNCFLGIEYTGEKALEVSTVVTAVWTFKEGSFPSQADLPYTVQYTKIEASIVEKYQSFFDQIYPKNTKTKHTLYIRGVLRNKLIQYDLIQNGWAMNLTTVVTSYLNTQDFKDNWGWATVFYLTDSYNSVRRPHICRSTTDFSLPLDQWDEPKTHSDFGTIFVFSKETLKPKEKLYINCIMPLQYKDLTGYLPPADKRQLRIATWSYDKTLEDGSNFYEGNHGHSIIPLKANDAPHYPAAVFKFLSDDLGVIATEKQFIEHFVEVMRVMSIVEDTDTKKSIFNGNLHSEGVYSILNYQFLNVTGVKKNPYESPEDAIDTMNQAAAQSALAIETYGDFTVEYLQKYLPALNKALQDAQISTMILEIVQDRVYLDSNGINICGSPTQRKCLVGGKQYNSSSCGGNGEASTEGCTLDPVIYNPFKNSSVIASTIFATLIAIVFIFF